MNVRAAIIWGAIAVVGGAGLAKTVSDNGGVDFHFSTTTTTMSFDQQRSALCGEQQKLLDHYIQVGDVAKMRQYQGYLSGNGCY
jgi:NAD(P)H-dependent flavin oxidoreductase YrpB (nitropropane dioxygenase family)